MLHGGFGEYAADPKMPPFVWLRFLTAQRLVTLHRIHLGVKGRDAGREVSLHSGPLPSADSRSLAAQLLGRLSTPSRAAMRAEIQIKIQDALNAMDPIDREILALRHFEELTNSETAAVLGFTKPPPATVTSGRYGGSKRSWLPCSDWVTARKPPDHFGEFEESERRTMSRIDRRPQSLRADCRGICRPAPPRRTSVDPRVRRALPRTCRRHPRSVSRAGSRGTVQAGAARGLTDRWPRSFPAARDSTHTQLGDYRILRYLGEGGMGVVYEAVRESLRSHVALKVMHPQYRNRPNYLRRFHTEARSAATLHHTNIVSVFDYGEHDGVCYYAMQYIAGQSLDKVLEDIRQLRLEKEGVPTAGCADLAVRQRIAGTNTLLSPRWTTRRCAAKSLRQTVTMGLLTGRFAIAGADERRKPARDFASFRATPRSWG